MPGTIDARLDELGIALPAAPTPRANYSPWIISGSTLYISGQVPFEDGELTTGSAVKTDAKGQFSMPLTFPGRARGYVTVPGYLAEPFDIDTARDKRPARIVLTRTTTILAAVFFATSFILTMLANTGGGGSILDGAGVPAAPSAPSGPATTNDLQKQLPGAGDTGSGPQVPISQ